MPSFVSTQLFPTPHCPTPSEAHSGVHRPPRPSRRPAFAPALALVLALLLGAGAGLAHETRLLGPEDGARYEVIIGMLGEPVVTEVRTGLDLIVRNAADNTPVEGLEASLEVTLTAPDGSTRTLTLRPQHGKPGAYTDDYILTLPGTYDVRVRGFIGDLQVDETYPREVADVQTLRFP